MNDHITQYDAEYNFQRSGNFRQMLKKFKINRTDLAFIIALSAGGIYLAVTQPLFMSSLGCMSIVWMGLWQIIRTVPILEKWLGVRIRFWHVASAIVSATALLSVIGEPAQAIFLSGLENWMRELATQSSAAGGGDTLDESTIGLIFNAIRGVFLLLVAAAALFAFNQAQQGNDWRPIATQVGLGFAIVIAVDVLTFLFVGDSYQ